MRSWGGLAVITVMLSAASPAAAQLPPGYWSYYDSGNKHYHRRAADYEMGRQRPAKKGSEALAAPNPRDLSSVESSRPLFWSDRQRSSQPFAAPLPTDSADYAGRGLTGRGFSAYQGNGYQGSGQNLYYGYWDGGFNTGMYGFSVYPHFDRPGFTYWQ